jgi:sigma-B regulation protein RsbU (phosphoserine phosphatase)
MNSVSKPIRIILVDNQPQAMSNISTALGLSTALQLVGQAADSQEAMQLCQMTSPEAALVNLAETELDGLDIIHGMTRQWPQMTVLVLAGPEQEQTLRAALEAGAAGYLPPDAAPEALAGTIEHVVAARRNETQPPTPPTVSLPVRQDTAEPRPGRSTELAEAARIQTSLLPAETPAIPGWEMAVKLQPARETSGDFYDFIALEHNKLGIVIGDVSDKGLGAALFMAMTSTLFRTFTSRQPSLPGLTMSAVNERVISDSGGSSFVTAFLGVLEPNTGRLRYVSAGHVPALLISTGKSKSVERLGRTGMALGILSDTTWQQKLVKFIPGDFLLLYTDGVLDAQDQHGEFYGEPRLLQVARAQAAAPAQQIVQAILSDILRFTDGAPVNDDLILLVLKRKG